jgi:phosphomannomutase
MVSNKKIIAFDLDGTLTESKQKLRYDMAELLLKLLEKTKVVIISGGSFDQFERQFLSSMREVFSILKLHDGDDSKNASSHSATGLIAPNALRMLSNLTLMPTEGTQRFEYDLSTGTWKQTHLSHFPEELKGKVMRELEAVQNSVAHTLGVDLPAETFGPAIEDRGTQITFSALGQKAPVDKKKEWDPDQAKRKKIKEYLEKTIPETDIAIGGLTSIDVVPKGTSKATSLNDLLHDFSLSLADITYVGDALFPGGNDYSVIAYGIEAVQVRGPIDTAKLIQGWLD